MRFISKKYSALRLVLDPKTAVEVEGRRVTKGLYGSTSGVTVEFHDNKFETEDKDLIKQLKAHRLFGVAFYSDDKKADEPNPEGLKEENEKHELAEEAGSICPVCGEKFKNSKFLDKHMKKHDDEA